MFSLKMGIFSQKSAVDKTPRSPCSKSFKMARVLRCELLFFFLIIWVYLLSLYCTTVVCLFPRQKVQKITFWPRFYSKENWAPCTLQFKVPFLEKMAFSKRHFCSYFLRHIIFDLSQRMMGAFLRSSRRFLF